MDNMQVENSYQSQNSSPKKLQFLVSTVCSIKNVFRENLNEILKKYKEDTGNVINSYTPPGCGGNSDYDDIWKVKDIEDFPDVVIDRGFGSYFRKEFVQRFLNKDYFKAVKKKEINKDFLGSGIEDKNNYYNIYAVIPFLFVIDKSNLGNLPIPTKWSNLLNPVYKNNIIIGGSEKDVSDILLLYIYKEHGESGLEKLASNVKNKMHWTSMVKSIGRSKENSAAIYIMPWFFAKACPKDKDALIIWPQDGAIISPMYMLVKKQFMGEMKVVTDFVTGVDFGEKSAKSFYPVLNPEVDNNLPEDASFKWIGWDFIESSNIEELKLYTKNVFMKYFY